MNIYIGNLSYDATEENIKELFEPFGSVVKVSLITDRDTGRSKGFGFVEMGSKNEGENAINELNGKDLLGRALNVNEARPREESSGGRGGFGGGRGGFGGGRGGNSGGGRGGQNRRSNRGGY